MHSFVLRRGAALAALAFALTACGGGSGSAIPSKQPGTGFTPNNDIPPALAIKNWNQGALQGATYVGPISNAHLSVNVFVHQQNAQALLQYAKDVNNPSSSSFRHWLTPQDLAARFGASKADYQSAANYFAAQGLTVGAWPQRMMLGVAGPQPAVERAFGTTFGVFSHNGQTFVAPMSTPHFAKAIPVDAVGKLVGYQPMHTYIMNSPRGAAGFNFGYSPQQVRAAFDLNGAYSKNYDGTGVTIAIIGTGPIAVGGRSGDTDLDKLASLYNARVAHVTQVAVTANGVAAGLQQSGIPTAAPPATPLPPNATPTPFTNGFPFSNAFQSPPPVSTKPCEGGLPTCNPEDAEAQLDVQQSASLAPGANVDFYLAYNAADCYTFFPTKCASTGSNAGQPQIGINEADPEIQQVIADAAGGNGPDIISMSYGGGEIQQFPNGSSDYTTSFFHLEFAAVVSEGIAAFASSGDSGSAECLAQGGGYLAQVCVGYPSGDPNVISVGGVTAYISSLGQLQAPLLAWGISSSDPNGYGASGATGGGTSTFMSPSVAQSAALHNALREQPDVSLVADPNTGVTVVTNGTNPNFAAGPNDIGGTSVAAPETAAVWALVLSACKANPGAGMCPSNAGGGHYWRMGNPANYLYAIYAHTPVNGITPALTKDQVFYDVLYGSNEMESNGGLPAVPVPGAAAMPGYDQTTGIGVPYAGHLIQAITGVPVP